MRGARYSPEIRKQAERLRKAGKTYAEIQRLFPIPKSTLSVWFNKTSPGTYNRSVQLEHLKKARLLAAEAITRARLQRERAAKDTGRASAQRLDLKHRALLKALLAMLYWSEGTKYEGVHGLKFVNTDPRLMTLYITLVRRCFPLDEGRFRVRVYVHHYHQKKKVLDFWSKLLGIPPSQFGKTYLKKRGKTKRFRQNFMGICFLYYPSNAIRQELMELGSTIHAILSPAKAPVV